MEGNKHIPKYIIDCPWYLQNESKPKQPINLAKYDQDTVRSSQDYLKHHRRDRNEKKETQSIEDSFTTIEVNSSRLRGRGKACTNCGANGHFTEDCLERPRKLRRGQKSEASSQLYVVRTTADSGSFDVKHDRWYGYDDSQYEKETCSLNKSRDHNQHSNQSQKLYDDPDWILECYKLGISMPKSILADPGNISVRTRTDRACYLDDLNAQESKYDPKSRL